MILHKYIVILTNESVQQRYRISAPDKEQAVILCQADAIRNARGYKLVSVEQIEDIWCNSYFIDIETSKELDLFWN